jgi:nitronate monooxygenase
VLHTRICDLLSIEHPIVSAPMAGSATAELAAAVSEAGGLGLIGGTSPGGPDWLRAQIRAVRERTSRPFGVGVISSFPHVEALVEVALAERVPVIAHSFADPAPYVAAAHAAGIIVLAQVQTVAQAMGAAQAGVDIIAAQGTEAGGHTGYSGTLPLVPAVIDAVGAVPVLAAGGIADGRGLAAALMLGAEGAWIGTRFVASQEWAGGDWAKERVVQAGTDDTVLTHAYDLATRAPFPAGIGDRVIKNRFTAEWHDHDAAVIEHREELAQTLTAATQGRDPTVAPVRAGSASGLIHAIEPAATILHRIIADAERLLRERPGALLGR